MPDEVRITVDMDKLCTRCGKAGALESGICLACAADNIKKLGAESSAPQFNEHNFELASLAIEDPEVFSINGIYVSRKKTAVTDGRIILEMSTPTRVEAEQLSLFGGNFEPVEKFEPFVMPKKEALEIAKAISLRHDKEEVKRARIGQGDDAVAVINVSDSKCDRTFVVQKLAQKFPDYGPLLSRPQGSLSITVNCDLLIPLLRVMAKATAGGMGSPVTITFTSQEHSVIFDWTNDLTGQSLRAAIAPMKVQP